MNETLQNNQTNAGNATKYKHRLSRRQFWGPYIFVFILNFIIQLLALSGDSNSFGVFYLPFVILLSYWAFYLLMGRLHDVNKSAWELFWNIIPFGGIYVFYLLCKPSYTENAAMK